MSLTASSVERDAAIARARFTGQEVDGELTVWDAERRRFILHQARWDSDAVRDVVASLSRHPGYVHLWDWSLALAGSTR